MLRICHSRSYASHVLWIAAALAAACSTRSPDRAPSILSPTAPSDALLPIRPMSQPSSQHGLELTPVIGTGSGIVNDTATANDGGFSLRGQVTIAVHGVPPDTLLHVQIAADVGLPGAPAGQQT